MTTTAFKKALEALINQHFIENASNTPDWILAQYLLGCLAVWNTGVQQRETWYGRDARPSAHVWNTGVQQRETWYGRDARPSAQTVPPPPAATEASAAPLPWRCSHGIDIEQCDRLHTRDEYQAHKRARYAEVGTVTALTDPFRKLDYVLVEPPPPAPTEAGSALTPIGVTAIIANLRHNADTRYSVTITPYEARALLAELARLRAAAKEKT